MPSVTGHIFSIERYAIHDGPGIRTQVFFQGCPLRCLWCCNPEGRPFHSSLLVTPALCIRCGTCVETCTPHALSLTEQGVEIAREACTRCGDCAAGCYARALEMSGFETTAEAVLDKVERDRLFYELSGGGGITLCGGEPLAQPAFALALLQLCKERGIHTALETCGYYPFDALEQAIPYLDFIYFDLKHLDAASHRQYTGAGNALILDNLRRLQAQAHGVALCVRVPVIPTLNDSRDHMHALASFLRELPGVGAVELLPYHRLGVNKYKKLGLKYPLEGLLPPGREEMEIHRAIFAEQGIRCTVRI